ncbi:CPBP family intramembrane glutamic endopeptidase [Curtobacterium sp. MCPF17_046]|uniref:CPBP family intramembrane glutamic endopeptidase n=1 Tax=Curtobacterium sp. MCPF17_046 TaxID=2175663 RepID=UPI000DA19878|nr:CPBP family intramembrane glutamic endopeptidase [Curtobacterium sp. MCPF17_046]
MRQWYGRSWYNREVTPVQPPAVRRRRRGWWPVPPSLLVGLAPLVVFAVVSIVRSRPSDDYPALGRTVDSVVRDLVVPEAVVAGILALVVTALGWWRIATVDPARGGPQWTMVAPLLVLAVCLGRLPLLDWGGKSLRYFLLLALGVLLVGVVEELMTRGVLLVGLRRRLPEIWVWALSCVLFGLLHFLNVLSGAPVATTVLQVVFATSFGSVLYLARRLTGNLLAPVLLHAFWDFGAIGVSASAPGSVDVLLVGLLGLATIAVLLLGVVAGGLIAWRDDRGRRLRRRWRTVPPLGAAAVRGPDTGLPAGADAPVELTS